MSSPEEVSPEADMLHARMDDAPANLTINDVAVDEALHVTNTRGEQPFVVGVPLSEPLPAPAIAD